MLLLQPSYCSDIRMKTIDGQGHFPCVALANENKVPYCTRNVWGTKGKLSQVKRGTSAPRTEWHVDDKRARTTRCEWERTSDAKNLTTLAAPSDDDRNHSSNAHPSSQSTRCGGVDAVAERNADDRLILQSVVWLTAHVVDVTYYFRRATLWRVYDWQKNTWKTKRFVGLRLALTLLSVRRNVFCLLRTNSASNTAEISL